MTDIAHPRRSKAQPFGATTVNVRLLGRTATIPRRLVVLGAVLSGTAVTLAGQRALHPFGFLAPLAGV